MSVSSVGLRQPRIARALGNTTYRTLAVLAAAATGFVVLRVAILANVAVADFPDTRTYYDLNFLGEATRLWAVPLLWKLSPDDTIAQVLLGAAAWVTLAAATLTSIRNQLIGVLGFSLVLILGLCAAATEWDRALLSESLTFSAMLFVISALLLLAERYSRRRVAFLLVALTAWLFARHADAWLFVLIAPLAIVALLATRRRELILVIAVPLTVLTGWAAFAIHQENTIWKYNAMGVIQLRILQDPGQTEFFHDRGMPYNAQIQAIADKPFRWKTPLWKNEAMRSWIDSDFRATYAEYLATHPGSTVKGPATYAASDMPQRAGYTGPREVVAGPARAALWSTGAGLLLLTTLAVTLALVALRARVASRALWVPLVGIAISGVWAVLTWNQAATELDRLFAPISLLVHVSVLLALLFVTDAFSRARRSAPSAT
jgi:hypothetical protein